MARFQFNVTQLLLLTTLVAVVAAIISWFDLPPAFALVVHILAWIYAICLGFWLVIRGPAAAREYQEIRRRRRDILEHRRLLAAETQARLEQIRAKAGSAGAPHGSPDRVG